MIKDEINKIVKESVETLGFRLLECKIGKSREKQTLNIVIFNPERDTSTADCVKVSDVVGSRLEIENLMIAAYNLIVESPGVDRVFVSDIEYECFVNREVKCVLRDSKKYGLKDNIVTGVLLGLKEDKIMINNRGTEMSFDKKDVAKTQLIFDLKKFMKNGGHL